MATFVAYLINPMTLCYMIVDKPFALHWRTRMGWIETTKAAYELALESGWVEYQSGQLHAPVQAIAARDI